MRRAAAVLFLAAVVATLTPRASSVLLRSNFSLQTSAGASPRLVVLIVVDQMRADYFERYADRFTDGFKRLWDHGAVFTDARYSYASTKTAEAHALMLSGWSPSGSGIVADRWYDRRSGSMVQATASPHHKL